MTGATTARRPTAAEGIPLPSAETTLSAAAYLLMQLRKWENPINSTDPFGLEDVGATTPTLSMSQYINWQSAMSPSIVVGKPLETGIVPYKYAQTDSKYVDKAQTYAAVGALKIGISSAPAKEEALAIASFKLLDTNVGLTFPIGNVGGANFSFGQDAGVLEAKAGFEKMTVTAGASAKLYEVKGDIGLTVGNISGKIFGSIGLGGAALGGSIGLKTSLDLGLGVTLKLGFQIDADASLKGK